MSEREEKEKRTNENMKNRTMLKMQWGCFISIWTKTVKQKSFQTIHFASNTKVKVFTFTKCSSEYFAWRVYQRNTSVSFTQSYGLSAVIACKTPLQRVFSMLWIAETQSMYTTYFAKSKMMKQIVAMVTFIQ